MINQSRAENIVYLNRSPIGEKDSHDYNEGLVALNRYLALLNNPEVRSIADERLSRGNSPYKVLGDLTREIVEGTLTSIELHGKHLLRQLESKEKGTVYNLSPSELKELSTRKKSVVIVNLL